MMPVDFKHSKLTVKYLKQGEELEKCGHCNQRDYTLKEPFVVIQPPVTDVPISVPFHWKCLVDQLIRESPVRSESFDGFEQLLYKDQVKMRKVLEEDEGRSEKNFFRRLFVKLQLIKQSKKWNAARHFFSKTTSSEVKALLLSNDQLVRGFEAKNQNTEERLADLFCFGVPENCPCGGIQVLDMARRTYVCTGYLPDFTKCPKTNANPNLSIIKMDKKLRYVIRSKGITLPTATRTRLFHKNSKWVKNVNGFETVKEKVESRLEAAKSVRRELNEQKKWVDGSWELSGKYAVHTDKNGVSYNAYLHFASAALNINSSCNLMLLKEGEEEYLAVMRGRFGVLETVEYEKVQKGKGVEKFEETYHLLTGNEWKDRSKFISRPGFFEQLDRDVVIEEPLPGELEDLMLVVAEDEEVKDRVPEARVIYHQCRELFPRGFVGAGMIKRVKEHLEKLAGKKCVEEETEGRWDRVHSLLPQLQNLDAPKKVNVDELMKKLETIEQVMEQVKQKGSIIKDPFNEMFQGLNCKAKLLTSSNSNFELISTYFQNGFNKKTKHDCRLKAIYAITPGKENLGNINPEELALLWHGTNVKYLGSIIKTGLRLSNGGGYFGSGIYFADATEKSLDYCEAPKDSPVKVLLLFKVNRGKMKETTYPEESSALDTIGQYNSVFGKGRARPEGWHNEPEFSLPEGRLVEDEKYFGELEHNEYCIYETNRCQLAFVVLFSHKRK